MQIFETAKAGTGNTELGILIGADGALRIVEAAGWSPEAMQQHYGARTLYHVTRNQDGVSVNGLGPGGTCALHSEAARIPHRHSPVPQYEVVCAGLLEAPGRNYTELFC